MLYRVDQQKEPYDEDVITCQTHCALFDKKTSKCGFFNNEVPNDPFYTAGCSQFLSEKEWDEFSDSVLLNESDESQTKLFYPLQPDQNVDYNAVWYVSPDQTFGCWIISLSKKNKFMALNQKETIIGWHDEVYKSPFPLHDHGLISYKASTVAWVIDEHGFGQYALVENGELHLFHP